MDPTENLKRQRALARQILDQGDSKDPGLVYELAELVEALDEWICAGGFLPGSWKAAG